MKKIYLISLLSFMLISCGSGNVSVSETSSSSEAKESTSSVVISSSSEVSSNSTESSPSVEDSSISESKSDSISESSSPAYIYGNEEVIYNDHYSWGIGNDKAYTDEFDFSLSSFEQDDNLTLKIDGVIQEKLAKPLYQGSISYQFKEGTSCGSDTVEHAYNEITFNGNILGTLPSDDSTLINVDYTMMQEGDNIFSVTIGEVYRDNVKYDPEKVHGGLGSTNSNGDDYSLGNIVLTLIDGTVLKPYKMVLYKPKAWNTKGYVTQEASYAEDTYYDVGDGWGTTADYLTYVNHPNPKYDRPYKIDFYFDNYTPDVIQSYHVDTKDYEDGKHTFTLLSNNNILMQNNVYFDNKEPAISSNLVNNFYVNKDFKVKANFTDDTSGVAETTIKIDNETVDKDEFYLSSLDIGKHNVTMSCTDNAGLKTYVSYDLTILDNVSSLTLKINKKDKEVSVSSDNSDNLTTKIYKANDVTLKSSDSGMLANNIPYEEYTYEVSSSNSVFYLSYEGTSSDNEALIIEALDPWTSDYSKICECSSANVSKFAINADDYVDPSGTLKIRIHPNYYGNGSNRLLWASDTQYLPKVEYTDINYMYKELMTYVANQYKENKMAYFAHTGDIVDDHPGYTDRAIAEWENATKAFDILDKAGVPYGVCAGNHDVGSYEASMSYTYYSTYFGLDRFNGRDYYGGNYSDNECHYDLVSIGDYDFVLLYLGFGREHQDDIMTWANQVLNYYSSLNAIVLTHAYLDKDGTLDANSWANDVYENIVSQNDNVKFVFSGHTDGNAINIKQEGDHKWIEILNCYQFVETSSYSVSHVTSGLTCNGEAFIKELIFDGDTLNIHTFSPVIGKENPFGDTSYGKDTTSLDISYLTPRNRSFKTNEIHLYEGISEVSNGSINSSENYLVVATDAKGSFGVEYI